MKKYIFLILAVLMLTSCTQTNTTNTPSKSTPTVNPSKALPTTTIPSPTYGTGKHAMTIWADFQCPACIAFAELVSPTLESYAERGYLTITYKQFPLTSIHPNAERDALAALCGAEQGKYMEYKKALYALESSKKGAKVSDADRVEAGKGILDESKLQACLAADTYLSQVRSEMAEGDTLGINSTPTVMLDGKKLDPAIYRDQTVLRTILDRLLVVPQVTASGVTISGSTK